MDMDDFYQKKKKNVMHMDDMLRLQLICISYFGIQLLHTSCIKHKKENNSFIMVSMQQKNMGML